MNCMRCGKIFEVTSGSLNGLCPECGKAAKNSPMDLLAKVSGMPKEKMQELWEEIKINSAKVHGCKKHRFAGGKIVIDPRNTQVTCLECGGNIDRVALMHYIAGYRAHGGNPDDIWPGWEKRHDG